MAAPSKLDSLVRLRVDVASARVLVWLATRGRDVELTEGAHLYFFDRYHRLADCYRRRGSEVQAEKWETKAEMHARLGGWDGPPYAAAMSMPRPRKWFMTDAVSRHCLDGRRDAA